MPTQKAHKKSQTHSQVKQVNVSMQTGETAISEPFGVEKDLFGTDYFLLGRAEGFVSREFEPRWRHRRKHTFAEGNHDPNPNRKKLEEVSKSERI